MGSGTKKVLLRAYILSTLGLAYSDVSGLDVQKPPSSAHIVFQKYYDTALAKGERRTPSNLLKAIAQKTGLTAVGIGAYMKAIGSIDYLQSKPMADIGHTLAISALLGTPTELYKEYQAASPGWLEQIKKINLNNISGNTVIIGKKPYLLAKSFNNIEQSGYANNAEQPAKGAYEFDLISDVGIIDLFFALETWFNNARAEVRDEIAFIALRPTPYLYSSHNRLTRQTLPQIIIGLKYRDVSDVIRKEKATSVLISLVDFLVPEGTDWLGAFPEAKDHPRYSQRLGRITFGAFGDSNDKDINPQNYTRHKGWVLPYPDDKAYPKGRENALKLPTIEELLIAREHSKHFAKASRQPKNKERSEQLAEELEKLEKQSEKSESLVPEAPKTSEQLGMPIERALTTVPIPSSLTAPPAPTSYTPPIAGLMESLSEKQQALVPGTATEMVKQIRELYTRGMPLINTNAPSSLQALQIDIEQVITHRAKPVA